MTGVHAHTNVTCEAKHSVGTALKRAIPWGRSRRGRNPESSVLQSTNGQIMYLRDDWCVWRTDLGARRF